MSDTETAVVPARRPSIIELSFTAIIYAGGFFLSSAIIAIAITFNWYSRGLTVLYYVVFAVVCLLSIAYSLARRPTLSTRRVVALTAVFWCLYIARLIWSCYFSSEPLLLPPAYYVYYAIGGGLIPMIAFFRDLDDKSSEVAYRVALISAAVSTGACVWVYGSLLGTDFGRLGMDLAESLNPLQVAYLGSAMIVLATYDILYRRAGYVVRSFRFVACLLFFALGFLALIIGASKGAILAVAVCVLCAVVARLFAKRFLSSAVLIVALVVGLPMLTNLTRVLGSGLVDRFSSGFDDVEGSRTSLIKEGVSDFAGSPILGSGIELGSQSLPHNLILEAYVTTGVFGGTLFLGLCLWAIARSLRILVIAPKHGWIALLFLHYFVFSQVSGALYLSWQFWYSYAAVMGLRIGSAVRVPRAERELRALALQYSQPNTAVPG